MIWIPAFVFFQALLVGWWLGKYLHSSASFKIYQQGIERPIGHPNLEPSPLSLTVPNGEELILTPGHSCEVIDLNAYREKKEREEKEREEEQMLEDISYLKAILAQIPDEPTTGPFPSFSHDLWDVDSWITSMTMSGSYDLSDFNGLPILPPVLDEDT